MDGATGFAVSSLINILLSLACIALSWWVLLNLRLDLFLRDPKGVQAKVLYILLSIIFGHNLASFLIDYMGWSRMIGQLFG
ncbi:putative integral membrane protein (TIGR02327 family) [Melghirimyces profundicolus]|uniref:Putative integral membrane protein (TIGR02327 family) n=1 Tax=Melghirimyces profundicolus TaxID=1242148 RepID=A0A2T6C2J3_9BACL|nr:DUF1146 family protein [Melghirimyces profundicolus]PTX62530.1 putative integral membrane protein (TIGR02327 family) [Melghirimyces profundicolus]